MAIVASAYARDYVDPSKRQKQELLEEGQAVQAASTAQGSNQNPVALSEEEKAKQEYCACNLLDSYATKAEAIANKLIIDNVINSEELWRHRTNKEKTEVARKKALHNTGLSETEAETICEQDYNDYTKLKEFDAVIKQQVKKCKFFKY